MFSSFGMASRCWRVSLALIADFRPLYPDVHSKHITRYFSSLLSKKPECQLSAMTETDIRGVYFLCFVNRCGSNYLAHAIASDRRLMAAQESLNHEVVINQSRRHGFVSYEEYLHYQVNKWKGSERIFGCKSSVGQLLFLYNTGLLQRFPVKPKFIHMVRQDVIKQAVSLYIADKTKQWTSLQQEARVEIKYDRDALISLVRSICMQNAAFSAVFQLLGVKPLLVRYENFVRRPRFWLKKVGEFLEVEDLTFIKKNVRLSKQSDERNDALVARLRRELALWS